MRRSKVSSSHRGQTAKARAGGFSRFESLEGRQLLSAELISVNLAGTGAGNGDSRESSVSGDGRYVVFTSTSNDLVANDTNGTADIFLRDRLNNTTTLISKNPTTNEVSNGESSEPKINADGTFVVFASRGFNLIDGDTAPGATGMGSTDVFRYNIATGGLELVSVKSTGGFPNGGSSEPSISADGRYVAYTSFASNLGINNDNNSATDVFRRDMSLPGGVNSVVLVSVGLGGAVGDKASFDPQISDNGQFVSFRSDATNMTTNDTNGLRDSFIRDINATLTSLVSVSSAGVSGNQESQSNSLSGDGSVVAFRSNATDLVANDTNNAEDIFLRNRTNNTTTLLTVNAAGTASARGQSRFPWLSADGTTAVFSSSANDLTTPDDNNLEDVFLRDLTNGPLYLLSTNPTGGSGNGASFDPFVSRDGKFVVFTSEATDVSVLTDNNAKQDVFITIAPNQSSGGDPNGGGETPPTPGDGGDGGGTPTTPTVDTTAPTASLPGSQPAPTQGSSEYTFNVNVADETAVNNLFAGDVTVTKAGGTALTATKVNIVGSGATATVTYRVTFASPLSAADTGTYTVQAPAGAFRDAAGNNSAETTLGTLALNVGSAADADLVTTITAKLPTATLVAGPKAKGTARVSIANNGQTATTKLNAPVPVSLYLSDNNSRDSSDILLGTQTKPLVLKTGKAKSLNFKFSYPANIGNGAYFLIAEADTGNTLTEANESNNVAVTSNSVSLAQPFLDLRAAIGRPTGTSSLTPGGAATSSINVINDGNVQLNQNVTITLAASSDAAADPSDPVLATFTKKLNIKPGATKAVIIKFNFPQSLPAGSYFATATIDPLGEISETSKSNNVAVTSDVFAFA